MNKPAFVLDANLIISATLLEQSVARQAFEKALLKGSILLSEALQTELTALFLRPKFDRYLSLEKRLRFLASLIQLSVPTPITHRLQVCRDPKDDMILELALAGQASCIVTGDQDLLVLHPFREIAILSPRQFLDEYEI